MDDGLGCSIFLDVSSSICGSFSATFSKHDIAKVIYFPLRVDPLSKERKPMVKYIRDPWPGGLREAIK